MSEIPISARIAGVSSFLNLRAKEHPVGNILMMRVTADKKKDVLGDASPASGTDNCSQKPASPSGGIVEVRGKSKGGIKVADKIGVKRHSKPTESGAKKRRIGDIVANNMATSSNSAKSERRFRKFRDVLTGKNGKADVVPTSAGDVKDKRESGFSALENDTNMREVSSLKPLAAVHPRKHNRGKNHIRERLNQSAKETRARKKKNLANQPKDANQKIGRDGSLLKHLNGQDDCKGKGGGSNHSRKKNKGSRNVEVVNAGIENAVMEAPSIDEKIIDGNSNVKDVLKSPYFLKWYNSMYLEDKSSVGDAGKYVIQEMRKAEKNSEKNLAVIRPKRDVLYVNLRRTSISVMRVHFSEEEKSEFKAAFETYGKNFYLIGKLLHRDIKDCIKFYYEEKRNTKYKKRIGRLSDAQLKTIIEMEWTSREMNIFERYYKLYDGDLDKISDILPNKDLKLYLRYYKKFLVNNGMESGWSMDDRQLFAIYFPYFNKNWSKYSEYIKGKRVADFSKYYRNYFKNLGAMEQQFETSTVELEKDELRNLFIGRKLVPKKEDIFLENVGIIFRSST